MSDRDHAPVFTIYMDFKVESPPWLINHGTVRWNGLIEVLPMTSHVSVLNLDRVLLGSLVALAARMSSLPANDPIAAVPTLRIIGFA